MAASWVHCNICRTLATNCQPQPRLHLTSCGRVVCQSCLPSLGSLACSACRGPCIRTLAINNKAPKEVLDLFSDPVEKLKDVFKIVNFQETQKSGLWGKQVEICSRQKEMFGVLSRRLETGSMTDQVKANLSRLVKQEAAVREELNRLTLGNRPTTSKEGSRPGGIRLSSHHMSGPIVFEGIGNIGVGKDPSDKNIEKQDNRSWGRRQGSGGRSRFLQLKTPAAWHHYQHVARNNKVLSSALNQLEDMRRGTPAEPAPRRNFFTPPSPPAGSSWSGGRPRR